MSSKSKITNTIQEIQAYISELTILADNLDKNFKNIGNDVCADKIREITQHYKKVKKKLEGQL